MAIFENSYTAYDGHYSSSWQQMLILPKYGIRDIFRSKIVTGMFTMALMFFLLAVVLIYLHHNTSVRTNSITAQLFWVNGKLIPINGFFFRMVQSILGTLSFGVTLMIGPNLIAADLSNNAMPLYLARPLPKGFYLLSKSLILSIPLSFLTWLPLGFLFFFQSSLDGYDWMISNLFILKGILLGSGCLVLFLTLFSMLLSAQLKSQSSAAFAYFAIPIMLGTMAKAVGAMFQSNLGVLLSPLHWFHLLWTFLYEQTAIVGNVTVVYVIGILAISCALMMVALVRSVHGFEVVS